MIHSHLSPSKHPHPLLDKDTHWLVLDFKIFLLILNYMYQKVEKEPLNNFFRKNLSKGDLSSKKQKLMKIIAPSTIEDD